MFCESIMGGAVLQRLNLAEVSGMVRRMRKLDTDSSGEKKGDLFLE